MFRAVRSIQGNSFIAGDRSGPTASRRPTLRLSILLLCLFLLLLVNVPAFVHMGPDSDNCVYDLAARNILWGMTPYKDTFENNFPGIVWMLMALRSVFGWSYPVLLIFDLFLFGVCTWILCTFLPKHDDSLFPRCLLAFVLLSFYLGTSEWNHAQRDLWMLFFALFAVRLRAARLLQLTQSTLDVVSKTKPLALSFLEGVCWAASFWIKPYIALPALFTWTFASVYVWRRKGRASVPSLALDGCFVAAGGLLTLGLGVLWLAKTGGLDAFWNIMTVWNPEYRKFDTTGGLGPLTLVGTALRFAPWGFVDLLAVPLALQSLYTGLTAKGGALDASELHENHQETLPPVLFVMAAFEISMFGQGYFLQHPFDYVHVPLVLVGVSFVALWFTCRNLERSNSQSLLRSASKVGLALFIVILVARSAMLWIDRVTLLPQLTGPVSSPALQDRLSLRKQINWRDLRAVAEYLKAEKIADGELTVFSMPATWLYLDLAIRPSTRFYFVQEALVVFAHQREQVFAALESSKQRFVICDLSRYGMDKMKSELSANPPSTAPESERWRQRMVFRAGNYVVFELKPDEMRPWVHFYFGY